MKRVFVILSATAAVALSAFALPGLARPQDSSASDQGYYGPCPGYGSGMTGPSYRAGMWGLAERGGAFDGMRRGGGLGPIWRLDLSDAQRAQVKKITDNLRLSHVATMSKLRDARAKLREIQMAPQPDPKEVGAAYEQVSQLRQDMLEATVQARNEVRSILTPVQRQRFDDWRDMGWGRREVGPDALGLK